MRSVIDPTGTGTPSAAPARRPPSAGSTFPIAVAAPDEAGMVEAWTRVISPDSMPNASCSTAAIGAREFVVQEPLENTSLAVDLTRRR